VGRTTDSRCNSGGLQCTYHNPVTYTAPSELQAARLQQMWGCSHWRHNRRLLLHRRLHGQDDSERLNSECYHLYCYGTSASGLPVAASRGRVATVSSQLCYVVRDWLTQRLLGTVRLRPCDCAPLWCEKNELLETGHYRRAIATSPSLWIRHWLSLRALKRNCDSSVQPTEPERRVY
jgi:hypothetical protein